MDRGPLSTVKTTCPYCGVGCGVQVTAQPGGQIEVSGDPDHPANFGRLCSKGSALDETISVSDRLLFPQIQGQSTSWKKATSYIADELTKTIEQHGSDSVAFYGSGQLLTEDYYIANKLMKGFIGSANIDTNSRLCMASSVAGHKRAFGSDTVPGCYEDLEQADLLVLTGSNLSWCHPVLFQRILSARKKNPAMKIVVIDPRRTTTAEIADLFLPLATGTDTALFSGLLNWLARNGFTNRDYVDQHVSNVETALLEAQNSTIKSISQKTQLSTKDLEKFYSLFANTKKVVTVYSQGINQAADGTNRVNAIINCHLLTGRIGRPGMGPFSVTGQPNAMGGREVGGLANQLACHMDIEQSEHREIVKEFWKASVIASRPGLKAVDLFKAIGEGKVKAVWIMATNPVVSLPDANAVKAALKACPLVIVSDVTHQTDTAACADVLLPAAAWGEKEGMVTNSERRISRQRAFMKPPGEAKPDWKILCDVATKMGWGANFSYNSTADIIREFAALSGFKNKGTRDFDISGIAEMDDFAYESFQPTQWPIIIGHDNQARFFSDGKYYTDDRRANMVPTPVPTAPQLNTTHPLTLNTGRIRDQWHTMTRTGRSARLSQHLAEPYIILHPDDAQRFGIEDATLVMVRSDYGEMVVRAMIGPEQKPGTLFAPMHWTDQYAAKARVDALVEPITDPISGQPALKRSNVAIEPFEAQWYGFALLPERPQNISTEYWALAKAPKGYRIELGGLSQQNDWLKWFKQMLPNKLSFHCNIVTYSDPLNCDYRFAAFDKEKFVGALFISSGPVTAARTWLVSAMGQTQSSLRDQYALLAGRPGSDRPDPGAIVCSCMNVGVNDIRTAINTKRCATVDDVGEATGAGTNCGSCRTEILRMIENERIPETA